MARRLRRVAAAGVAAAAVGMTLAGCAADVGTPPGLGSARALAVNEHGVALVQAWAEGPWPSSSEAWSAWTLAPDGAWTPVSPPGAEPDHRVVPVAINAGGTVVGTTEDPEAGMVSTTAFAWHPVEGGRVLEPLRDGDLAYVADINEGGTVVGESAGDGIRAVRWEPGATEPIELATPTGWSYAQPVAINDSGVIVGVVDRGAAVVWEPPSYAPRVLPERGPTYATDIDEDGTVVGYSARRFEPAVGLRWSSAGEMTELGNFVPVAIDDGSIVGRPGGSGSGWLWPAGADAPESLGNTPGRQAEVTDIAGGHIVGYLVGADDAHAARFTPNP